MLGKIQQISDSIWNKPACPSTPFLSEDVEPDSQEGPG